MKMRQNISLGIDNLLETLRGNACKKLFIVTGSHTYASFNFKDVISRMDVSKVFFNDFTPNPLYEQVCNGVDLFERENCDSIVAIGGGSAIDVAKCIKLAVLAKEGKNAIIPPMVNTGVHIEGTKIPLIAIPTTAGTGSESTHNAVIYYNNSKQTVVNDYILPDYAILESSVLKSLPLYQKKCTMMDALCQGIESWWSVNSTEESYCFSQETVALIMRYWKPYIFENDDEAAANIMLAANYSGRAINVTQTTAAHAMSYKITSHYGLPHGHAVAICLPAIWKYMINHMDKCVDPRGTTYLSDIFIRIAKAIGKDSPFDAVNFLFNMNEKMELDCPMLHDFDGDLAILISSVNPIRLKNNPIYLDDDTIANLYKTILKKYDV